MTTSYSGISRYHSIIRKNAAVWCLLFVLAFLGLVLRLGWLQLVRYRHFNELGERYRFREAVLTAQRGRILDCNLQVLACDDDRLSLYADPTMCVLPWEVDNDTGSGVDFVAAQLSLGLGTPKDTLKANLQRQVSFVWIKRDVEPETANAVRGMGLPGVQVKEDGAYYRVGVDFTKVQPNQDVVTPLVDTLQLKIDEVSDQLGLTPLPEDKQHDAAPTPTGQRWVRGVYRDDAIAQLRKLKMPGLLTAKDRPAYSVGADPRPYLTNQPGYNADAVARQLAPALKLSTDVVRARLQFRPRFAWLQRGMSEETLARVTRLQSTLFVVQPGRILSAPDEDRDSKKVPLDDAVDRLHEMLNEKGKPETISRAEIKRRLMPGVPFDECLELLYHILNDKGAPEAVTREQIRALYPTGAIPCPLGLRQTSKGAPVLEITRRLAAKVIPGVVYGLPGVATQKEHRRRYLYNAAAPSLGFTILENDKMRGVFGIEETQEQTLAGKDGFESKEIDARRNNIPDRSKRVDAQDGCDVVLTINRDIQVAAEQALAEGVSKAHAAGGQCVVMDPATGDILAMASLPTWDANDPGASTVPLVNPIISHFYEPGSTFKLVAVMAALEEGLIKDGQQITYCSGGLPIGNRVIHESHNAHGAVDAGRLLEQSCNIGAAVLSTRLGKDTFLSWCDRLGFGKLTGIELRNESPGFLNRKNADAKITLANMGFGQSLAVTPLQMAAAYSAVANGGLLVKPHLIKARFRRDGTKEEPTYPTQRVCSEETARLLRGYLERVVTKGTGGAAAIPGYSVAGKTGTAQKPGEHGYGSGKAIGSFIGFVPADKPRLTIIAIIDEPQGSHYGGVIAAPIFKAVGQQALHYRNIPSNQDTAPRPVATPAAPTRPVAAPAHPAAPAHSRPAQGRPGH